MLPKLRSLLAFALLVLPLSVISQEFEPKDYCTNSESCWPSLDVFNKLGADHPSLEVVLRGKSGWNTASDSVLNRRVAQSLGAVIYATTVDDIVAVVKFTQDHNLNLKIVSSGHEFIGRNTAEGAIQLSVKRMRNISHDLSCAEHSAGCLTVEPGVLFLEAYKYVDDIGRIVLGGSEPTVSVTGWALGGGHSPVSPRIGLGVDQILEVDMVLADLSVVTLNKDGTTKRLFNGTVEQSSETDLFWAIRGGGGGTFGVVSRIVYKLHMPSNKFTTFNCLFATVEGAGATRKMFSSVNKAFKNVMKELSNDFGGYIISSISCYLQNPCKRVSTILYSVTYYGAESDDKESFDRLHAAGATQSEYYASGAPCSTKQFESFNAYNSEKANVTYTSLDLKGSFISTDEFTDDFIERESKVYARAWRSARPIAATYIRLGGQTRNTSSGATAVNPLFRNALFTLAFGGDDKTLKWYDDVIEKTVASRGQYFSECDDDLPPGEWQKQFWGDSYPRLLEVKRKYDPTNHFTCKQCVGSTASMVRSVLLLIWLCDISTVFTYFFL